MRAVIYTGDARVEDDLRVGMRFTSSLLGGVIKCNGQLFLFCTFLVGSGHLLLRVVLVKELVEGMVWNFIIRVL